ncbi:isopeptide-forming domain-containing fimbrial protein [Frisingicoccus sp.]|uniref:isopeptide-forming domain-containing fimbrial protein n=1 Tax=Frisingicoccus sp. TaxID=1918627 RepID=UPI003AB12BBB
MKKLKRILAILMTMAMVLGMTVTASAETGKTPTAADTTTASVTNVEAGAKVTAYRIIAPNYNNGFTGYSIVSDVKTYLNGVDMTANGENPAEPTQGPSAEQIQKIAKAISNDSALAGKLDHVSLSTYTKTSDKTATEVELGTYSADLGAGYWVVIIESTGEVIYNPMLLGVYYSTADGTLNNDMTGGIIDAKTNWTLSTEPGYAKSSRPSIDKKIVDAAGNPVGSTTATGNTNNGVDVAAGDTVYFEVDAKIPAYSDSYEQVTYKITDTLSDGLTRTDAAPVVKVGDDTVTAGDNTFKVSYNGQTMTIEFASAYALANAGKDVVVTYSATLDADAGQNFDMNSNTAKLTYSNNPSDSSDVKEIEDKTYTYTFEIDGNLNGEDGENEEWVTKELIKVDADKFVEKTEDGVTTRTYTTPLAGAEFKLVNNDTKKEYKTTSTTDGKIHFSGLDAGTYTLTETKAPAGYSVNTAEIPVVISATYNEDGTLASYEIKINNEVTSTYTATYEGTTVTTKEVKDVTNGSNTYDFLNTKLANLPSTGGIGTYIFTIAGIIIMAAAAGFFFVSRRKAEK